MQMTEAEIVKSYQRAEKKREKIRILSELNACPKQTIRDILEKHGEEVPKTGNRYTVKKPEVTEANRSKRKKTRLKEAVDDISAGLNAMVRDAAEGLNKAAARDGVETSGSIRKRLLKNEEQTDSSDLSTPEDPVKTMFGVSLEAKKMEEVGTHQKEVGTMSEKKATPTCCQPADPVDIWNGAIDLREYDEDTIELAEIELQRLNGIIKAMEQDIKWRKLEIQADKCKAEYIRLWLQNAKGVTEG